MKMTITPLSSRTATGQSGGISAVRVPASKSHTIRALLIAALADGESRIEDPLDSADTRSCIEACRKLGAGAEKIAAGWRITGTGGRPRPTGETIDVGNSGTTLYLAAGLAALADQPVRFTGDEQIRRRSAAPLLKSLADLGAAVTEEGASGCAPFTIQGPLKGGTTSIECPTSQYLSSLLLALPLARGASMVEVPLLREKPYAGMTLQWLREQGIPWEQEDYRSFRFPGGGRYRGFRNGVPGDYSSATFLFCAAAITGSRITLEGLRREDPQGDKAVLDMLTAMGCRVEWEGQRVSVTGPEPGSLRGALLDLNDTPDALPALAATACYARGVTELVNVPQARMKETDRIAVMAAELGKMGAAIEERPEGLIIRGKAGTGALQPLTSAAVAGHKDHRVIMALAIAALGARPGDTGPGATTIDSAEAVGITFPGFFPLLEGLFPGCIAEGKET